MAHAEKCPICYGDGVVMGIYEAGTQPTQECHGCRGKGWVEVSDEVPVYPPNYNLLNKVPQ